MIPDVAAGLSAAGAMISDLTSDFTELLFTTNARFDFARVNQTLEALRGKCLDFINGPGAHSVEQSIEYFVEGRYLHQVWEIDVPLRGDCFESSRDVDALTADFHKMHGELFAFHDPDSEIELVSWRARARCRLRESTVGSMERASSDVEFAHRVREVYFGERGTLDADVVWFEAMQPNEVVMGPAIVDSPFTTVVVDPGADIRRTILGNLVVKV